MCYQKRYLSLFHIKCVDVPNPELHRGFLAVLNKWEGLTYLDSAKKLRVLL